ncbi:universal stress protein [uncultured Sulfitobacter sp.]|uniref:universal stress protein n=1 Tax=uncultured Sulfitobacter sp. TaxID=191468 RepID=UPI002617CD5E|nr:universal stress protein [uncultured Sulfitobacter sp.]
MGAVSHTASFRHILVGVDGSAPACRAAVSAARLALALNAKLTFLAVAREVRASKEIEDYAKLEGIYASSFPLLRKEAEFCLAAAVISARELGLKGTERLVQTGDVAQTIARVSHTHGADCIVLGRSSHGAMRTLFTRSVVKTVEEIADKALLLIP